MRRTALVAGILVVLALAGAFLYAKSTVRWNDVKTMPPPLAAAVRAFARGDDATGVAQVKRLLTRYRAPAWDARGRLLAAEHLSRAGRAAEALEFLPKDLPDSDPLALHASLLRARALLARGRHDLAVEAAARAAAAPGFPARVDALIVRAQALEAKGAWREGVRGLDGENDPDAVIAAARTSAAHGDREGARRRLVASVLDPGSRAEDVDRLVTALAECVPDPLARLTGMERPALAGRASALLEDGRPEAAVTLLHCVRPSGDPAPALPPEALVEAEALLKLGRAGEAASLVARARTGDPATRDGATYLAARMAAGEGRTGVYRSALEGLARKGSVPWRLLAALDLARLEDGIPTVAAFEAYRRYRIAAGAQADPTGVLREAWLALELGRSADADAGLARCLGLKDAPDGVRAAALYWTAWRAQASGRAADARERYGRLAAEYPNHYYGALAARRVGLAPPVAPADLPRIEDPSRVGASGRWLVAARALASVGLFDEAAPCFRAAMTGAKAAAPRIALEAARAAIEANVPADAVLFAQAAAGDRSRAVVTAIPRPLWRLLYPAPVAEPITRFARANGLDPDLVAAVALQESAYNPLAVSSAGARGLLQLLPDVAAELAKASGLSSFKVDDLLDPEINLRLGCAHLHDYVRKTGSVPRALAAYNGGPARVLRWTIPKDDDERFVERIPIAETRLYVKRVLANQRMYAIAWPDGLGR